jgi:hypothetical protein
MADLSTRFQDVSAETCPGAGPGRPTLISNCRHLKLASPGYTNLTPVNTAAANSFPFALMKWNGE